MTPVFSRRQCGVPERNFQPLHNFPRIPAVRLSMLKGTGGSAMDGLWELFCATGDPVFYLLYRQPLDSGEGDGAKTA